LAKIALISAERTPIQILLMNKRKNQNGAVTVIRRRAQVKFGTSKHELFRSRSVTLSDNGDEEVDSYADKNNCDAYSTGPSSTRRVSLSMILGVVPGCDPPQRYDSTRLERVNSERALSEEEITELRREFFGMECPPATDFRTIPRKSIAGYRSLEVLLKPFYNEPIVDIDGSYMAPLHEEKYANEEAGAGAGDLVISTDEVTSAEEAESTGAVQSLLAGEMQADAEGTKGSPAPTAIDGAEFMEMGGSDHKTKFRFNKQGDVYVSDSKGNFTRCAKNMSMYYDMLTEDETMTTLSHLTDDVHEMTANDMFKARQQNEDDVKSKCSPGQTVEEYWEQEKKRRIQENHDFVETLARISEFQLEGAPKDNLATLHLGVLNTSLMDRQESSFSQVPDFATPPPELEDSVGV
jgi:hypothetical protein